MLSKKRIISVILISVILILNTPIFTKKAMAEENKETWVNTNFNDTLHDYIDEEKVIDTIVYNEKLYVVEVLKGELLDISASQIQIKNYDGTTWKNVGETIALNENEVISEVAFCKHSKNLYLIYSGIGFLGIKQMNQTEDGWTDIIVKDNVSGQFGATTENDITYLNVINENETDASIFKFDGSTLTDEGKYYSNNGYITEPRIAILDGIVYTGVRQVGKLEINVYSYINKMATKLNTSISGTKFTMTSLREKIYIVTDEKETDGLIIYTYDGRNWNTIRTNITYGTPSMTIKENEIYVLTSAWVENGKLKTYSYSKSTQTFVQEGDDVDEPAIMAQAIVYDGYIYTIYQHGTTKEVMVKKKVYIPDYYRGDINQDGRVSIADAIYGSKSLAGSVVMSDDQKSIGDVNDDGRFSVADLIKIAKFLNGSVEKL